MSFTSISVIILTLIGLTLYKYSKRGYKRGLTFALVDLSVTLFSVFFGALFAILLSSAITDSLTELLSEFDFYEELEEMLMGYDEVLIVIVKMLLTLIFYIPVFYLLRLFVKIIVSIISHRMCAKKIKDDVSYYKEGEDFYVKKNKAIAAFVGAFTGFLISLVVFSPLAGIARTATAALGFVEALGEHEIIEEDIIDEEVIDTVEYITDDFSVRMVAACGGRTFFGFATTVSIDGEYTNLGSELEAIFSINFSEFGELVEFNGDSADTARRIRKLTSEIEKSKILKMVFVETVKGLATAWLEGEEYMGAPRPVFEGYNAVDSFINEVLYVCSTSTTKTITADINSLINVSSILIDEQELLSSGDYLAIMDMLANDNIIDKIKDELEKNDHMRPVLYAVDDLIMSVIAEEVQDYTKYAVEDCEDLFFEISEILTSTGVLTDGVRVSAVADSIKERLDSYGVPVPDALNESIAETLIEGINGYGGEVSFDDVKDYFEDFLSNGSDISDFLPQE